MVLVANSLKMWILCAYFRHVPVFCVQNATYASYRKQVLFRIRYSAAIHSTYQIHSWQSVQHVLHTTIHDRRRRSSSSYGRHENQFIDFLPLLFSLNDYERLSLLALIYSGPLSVSTFMIGTNTKKSTNNDDHFGHFSWNMYARTNWRHHIEVGLFLIVLWKEF